MVPLSFKKRVFRDFSLQFVYQSTAGVQFSHELNGLETRTVRKGQVDQHQVGDNELCTPGTKWECDGCGVNAC